MLNHAKIGHITPSVITSRQQASGAIVSTLLHRLTAVDYHIRAR